jgi:hypothetical protein
MESDFILYRKHASMIEDEYYEFKSKRDSLSERIHFLNSKLSGEIGKFDKICLLRLLFHEVCLAEIKNVDLDIDLRSKKLVDELFSLAGCDPLSLTDCASYYLYDLEEIQRAKYMSLYAVFVAEHFRVYVRHSHQLLFRIAYKESDLAIIEATIRRISEYSPDRGSPDPAIEPDIIRMVEDLDLDPMLKVAFFRRVSDSND